MKKKTVGLIATLSAVSVLGLASCTKDEVKWAPESVIDLDSIEYTSNPDYSSLTTSDVNVYLNYAGSNGVSYRGTSQFTNTITGETYTTGKILPTFKALGADTKVNIVDVAKYTTTKDADTYTQVKSDNFKGEGDKFIDLFYNTTANITEMGAAGQAVDLVPYIKEGKMPYFTDYLKANPEVLDQITTNGHIYYTPYYDGYQEIERMLIMDTEMVTRLLDGSVTGDTTTAIGTGRLGTPNYKPFMDDQYNYENDNTEISVANAAGTSKTTIKVKRTDNIIKQQNTSLANTATTGSALLTQFKAYLTAAYGGSASGSYGTASNPLSNIFVGQNACYNADDLIALMRVIRANPAAASGVASTTTVEILMPRGENTGRVDNMYDFASIWGIQGTDGENGTLFIDAAGKLNDAKSTVANYDALELLNDIYSEGLILSTFADQGNKNKNANLEKYYQQKVEGAGAGFMMYDYSASTTIGNTKDAAGIGTADSARKGDYANHSKHGTRPVISPVSYWNTTKENDAKANLYNKTTGEANKDGKTLVRYAEANRALKNNSWCLLSTAPNKEAALRLMDYTYSEKGSNYNDFGSQDLWGALDSNGKPTLKAKTLEMYLASGEDFWTFMREYYGATNGIGYQRSATINLLAMNADAQKGQTIVDNAIDLGVMKLAKADVYTNYGFGVCAPTASSFSVTENAATKDDYKIITDFWTAAFGTTGWRQVVIQGATDDLAVASGVTYKNVLDKQDTYSLKYLAIFSEDLHMTPSWLSKLSADSAK